MQYTKYDVFLKIIELNSLSKAANYCSYSQSAVSQMVQSIEKDLSIKLLNRNNTGVWLTSEGKQLIPYIKKLSDSYQKLNEKSNDLINVHSGLIRIGTFSSVSCHILVPILKLFKYKYPYIRFELFQGDYKKIEEWINNEEVDFGFVTAPTKTNFHFIPVKKDKMVAILPKNHDLAKENTIPLSLFEKEPVILLEEGTKREVLKHFKTHNIEPRIEYLTEDDYTILSMVENHLGISILGELVINKTNYNIITKETNPPFFRDIGIALKSKTKTSISTKKFIEFINTFEI